MKKNMCEKALRASLLSAVAAAALLSGCGVPEQPFIGMVEADETVVSSMVPGRIQRITVHQGQAVKRGDLLVSLDPKFMDAKIGQAEGMVGAAESRYELAKNGARAEDVKAAKSQRDAAKHQLDLAEKSWARVEALWKDSVISRQQRDETEFKLLAAREQLAMAESRYELAKNGARAEDLQAAKGQRDAAQAALREAKAYGDETALRASFDGEVSKLYMRSGEVVGSGTPVLSMYVPTEAWVALAVREDKLPLFETGSTVEGTVPALGGEKIAFRVASKSALADFATWRASGAKGEFDLRSFELRLEPVAPEARLRPGMSVRFERPGR